MTSRQTLAILLVLCIPLETACAAFSPKDVANPTNLTVESALRDVGAGFAAMQREVRQQPNMKLGLFPCKVTVSLNVTASADQGGKLTLDASTAPTTTQATVISNTFSAAGHVEQTNTSSATRGNNVVVELYSVPCIPKDTLAGTAPDKVSAVLAGATSGLSQSPMRQRVRK